MHKKCFDVVGDGADDVGIAIDFVIVIIVAVTVVVVVTVASSFFVGIRIGEHREIP